MKARAHLAVVFAWVWGMASGAEAGLPPPVWTIEPIDLAGVYGWDIRMAVAPDGTVHAAGFRSGGVLGAWYAVRKGGAWSVPEFVEGSFGDLALDAEHRPHLLVRRLTDDLRNSDLVLLSRSDDGGWDETPVVTAIMSSAGISLAFDTAGRVHVGYIDTSRTSLYHLYWDGATWRIERVAGEGSFRYGSANAYMILDRDDVPHFIWYNFDMRLMTHGVRGVMSYAIRVIGEGFGSSIAVDLRNHLHVPMRASSGFNLQYFVFDGSSWSMQGVDSRFSDEGAIALDAEDVPHIIYGVNRGATVGGTRSETLLHATWDGAAWVADQITSWPSYSNGPEHQVVRVDADDRMHVVFTDDDKNLFYATALVPQPCAVNEGPDCDGNGVPDECQGDEDSDGDGLIDPCDLCPVSVLTSTVAIDGCDSGVANVGFEDGCTVADRVAACRADAATQGQVVRCAVELAGLLRAGHLLDQAGSGRLIACAARSPAIVPLTHAAPGTPISERERRGRIFKGP